MEDNIIEIYYDGNCIASVPNSDFSGEETDEELLDIVKEEIEFLYRRWQTELAFGDLDSIPALNELEFVIDTDCLYMYENASNVLDVDTHCPCSSAG